MKPCPICEWMDPEVVHIRDVPAGVCRWCFQSSAWSWSFEGEPHADDVAFWRLQDDWEVCDPCHKLALAQDDLGLVGRIAAARDARAPGLNRLEVWRFRAGAEVAHWVAHRTTFRALDAPVFWP